MRLTIDIETDGLNPTKIWVIVAEDIDNGTVTVFREPTRTNDAGRRFIELLGRATKIVGHHFIKFDYNRVIRRFFSDVYIDHSIILDTLVCSRLFNYRASGGHSLEAWANRLGLVKPKIADWSQGCTDEMVERCVADCRINTSLFKFLEKHINHEAYKKAIELEHKMEFITLDMEKNGFFFNFEEATKIREEIEKELEKLDGEIAQEFKPKAKLIKEITPKKTKSGTLSLVNFKWLGDAPDLSPFSSGCSFSLIEFVPFNPASPSQIVERLNLAGWKPTSKTKAHISCERELRLCRDKKRREELQSKLEHLRIVGWKVDEENLDTLPEDAPESARKLAQRILLSSRRSVLTEWINAYNPSTGRIHGTFNGIGSWTHRMSHQEPNQGNIPSDPDVKDPSNPTPVEKWKLKYSKSLRALWTVPKKKRLIGVDADGIQLRVFAHYTGDKSLIEALVNGDKDAGTDVHSLNAKLLSSTRSQAKTFIYAFLLGAGVDKVGIILHTNNKEAREKQNTFIEGYPGLKNLKQSVIPQDAKRGYFFGLDGRLVPVPSEHHVLAGYLQNGESTIMKVANVLWKEKLQKENIPFWQVDFVHDEWQTETEDDDDLAKYIGEVQAQSIVDAGEMLNLRCPLAGSISMHNGKVGGYNWAETH